MFYGHNLATIVLVQQWWCVLVGIANVSDGTIIKMEGYHLIRIKTLMVTILMAEHISLDGNNLFKLKWTFNRINAFVLYINSR